MKPTMYATLSNTPYVLPPDPGITPVIPANTTAAKIQQLRDQHVEAHTIYENERDMNNALKAQIIDCIEDT